MAKVKSNKPTAEGNISAGDLRQDLKDFKDTKKSFEDLMKIKQNSLLSEANADEQNQALKLVENKALSALDKLFEGKNP